MDNKIIVNQLSEFENAIRRFSALRKKNPHHGYFESSYLFRGQPDGKEIIASLFREYIDNPEARPDSFHRVLQEEYALLCNWVSRANEAGMKFPFNIWNYIKRNGESAIAFVEGGNHIEKHYPAMAISRHYGCKNRLIDFTKDAHAGLFFAVTSAIAKMERTYLLHCNENGEISNDGKLKFKNWLIGKEAYVWVMSEVKRQNADIIIPDYGNNDFARAQSAIFLLAPVAYFKTNIDWNNLIFSQKAESYGFKCENILAIPYARLPKLYIDMEKNAINHIQYFPSPESVVQSEDFLNRVKFLYNFMLFEFD